MEVEIVKYFPEILDREGKMSTFEITLIIEPLEEGPYLGTSPDLPGLIIQADTPEEVLALAPGVAQDLIAVMREVGQPLPPQLHAIPTPRRIALMVSA
jgi:predicted RNase H-like HicB family nuclease